MRFILLLSIILSLNSNCFAQNPQPPQEEISNHEEPLNQMPENFDLKNLDLTKFQAIFDSKKIKSSLKLLREKMGMKESPQNNKVIEFVGDKLGPFGKKILYIASDERFKTPLNEIYKKQRFKKMIINQIIFIILFLLIKSYFTSKTRSWGKIILINVLGLFLFWIGLTFVVPFTVYGSTYGRLLKGLYQAIQSLP